MSYNKIQPADRVLQVKEYYFSRKLREIARMNAEGADIISLGIGSPDRPPHPSVIETLVDDARRSDAHGYQPNLGLPELRKAWSDWYSRHYGVNFNPDTEVLPLIGSKEGVFYITMAFVNPGDAVLIPNPGYPTYTSAARLAGARILSYNLCAEHRWQPDFDALEQMDLSGVKLMWLNYPHMPTGAPARMQTFERAVDFARRHGIVLAHDNPYSFILNSHPLSLMQAAGARDVAIELNSLSKSGNMPGWRMAVAVSNPDFISWVVKVKSNVDSGQFRPAMKGAIQALQSDDAAWYSYINNEYAARRTVAEEIMRSLGCKFDPEQRGMFLWGRIPESCPGSESMSDAVLDRARVFITPGFIFGSQGERYVRISLCASLPALQLALDRINQAFNS